MKKLVKVAAAAAVFGMVAGTAFQGVNYAAGQLGGTRIEEEAPAQDTAKLATVNTVSASGEGGDVSAIAEQVLPSIVAIDVTAQVTSYTPFGLQTGESSGSGSGIILAEKDNRMYIATNNHVIDGADTVTIRFNDDSTASAQVKGTDAAHDLAVVEVDMGSLSQDTLNAIKIAVIGDSDATKVGEQAIAIGNALGYGTSVTVGYVSAKDREIDAEDSDSVKLIQTDAAINPGNSGGALVNSRGEVIGINSSKFASEEIEGMGFAIPISTAQPILEELMTQKTVNEADQAYLGISGRDVTEEMAEAYGMPEGIYIAEVTEGSPAEKAGLRKGYIITKFNGREVKTIAELQERLSHCQAGEDGKITVKISDNGDAVEKTLAVTFGSRKEAGK